LLIERGAAKAPKQHQISVIVACACDLMSYESRIENLDLVNQLRKHIAEMDDSAPWANIFRRSLNGYWFSLSTKDPIAIAKLGGAVAVKYFSLGAQARNLSGRLVWMNSTGETKPVECWLRYHGNTYDILLDVMKQCSEVKQELFKLRTAIERSHRPA
jgi:hypothetical protein